MQGYTVISNSPPTNAWIEFTFTKTNGQAVVVAVTNQFGWQFDCARQPVVHRDQHKSQPAGERRRSGR